MKRYSENNSDFFFAGRKSICGEWLWSRSWQSPALATSAQTPNPYWDSFCAVFGLGEFEVNWDPCVLVSWWTRIDSFELKFWQGGTHMFLLDTKREREVRTRMLAATWRKRVGTLVPKPAVRNPFWQTCMRLTTDSTKALSLYLSIYIYISIHTYLSIRCAYVLCWDGLHVLCLTRLD